MKISLVMIVKNEERTLEKCLRSAASLVDEMIVADTGSADGTKAVAERMGAKVYDYGWMNDFSDARNFALSHSSGDWNLILDADEILRPCQRDELEQAMDRYVKHHGARWMGAITRYDVYPDGEGTSVSVTSIPRLLPAGMRYTGIIHEQPDTEYPCYKLSLEADHDGYLMGDKGERNLSYLEEAVKRCPEDLYYKFQLAATLRNMKRYGDSLYWFRDFYAGYTGELKEGRTHIGAYLPEGVLLYLYTLLDAGSGACLEEAYAVVKNESHILGERADFWFVCGLFYMKLVLSDVATYVHLLPEIEASYLKALRIGEQKNQDRVIGTGSFKAAYNLGTWYEVSGEKDKAAYYYMWAAKEGYGPAKKRLELMGKCQ
ncbi:MAG: glycosyltransferase family 2 protein [Enterocloster citroniae]|nr:glycosyltransferase family 2 protein [Enterocloster citroniae]